MALLHATLIDPKYVKEVTAAIDQLVANEIEKFQAIITIEEPNIEVINDDKTLVLKGDVQAIRNIIKLSKSADITVNDKAPLIARGYAVIQAI